MISTIAEVLARRGRWLFAAFALAVVAAMFTIYSSPAHATSGRSYDLANIYNTDADVTVYWYNGTFTNKYKVVTDTRVASKDDMYVQMRPIRSGYSFGWIRLSNDVDKGYYNTQYRQYSPQIAINAYQVRLCNNGVFSDSCAAARTIYRYS